MKRSWPVCALIVLFFACVPMRAGSQSALLVTGSTAPVASVAAYDVDARLPNDPDIPPDMRDAMRIAQAKYLEGSNLIKLGESDKARVAFNKAVDGLLRSDWDMSSSPGMNRFFQDLVHRIQQDESRYLRPDEERSEDAVVDQLDALDLIPITVDPSLRDEVAQDLANSKYDIPITLNDRVLKSLNYWLTRGRKFFEDGLLRSGRYRDMITEVFRENSIPLDVMYLAQVESLFKPHALSTASAKGIWQFGKWTAIRYGLKVNGYVDERSDPEKSTRAAARYLTDLYAMFKDWNLVLAAYNCGEAKIQRLIENSGLNDFWELAELRRNLPEETKNHVPLIMASIILARNPEKYGLPKELDQPRSFDSVFISKAVDLRSVAKILDISLENLKELNPALRGVATPADYANYELKIPSGTDPELGRKIAALPPVSFKPEPELASRHKVRRGETLQKIANRYRISVASLQKANGLRSSKSLRVGTWIRLPQSSASRSASSKSKTFRAPTTRLASSRIKASKIRISSARVKHSLRSTLMTKTRATTIAAAKTKSKRTAVSARGTHSIKKSVRPKNARVIPSRAKKTPTKDIASK